MFSTLCFCGCGRKVRGSEKRASQYGERAVAAVAALEQFSMPIHGMDPDRRRVIDHLIGEGRRYTDIWLAVAHDEPQTPPPGGGMALIHGYKQWSAAATQQARMTS